MKKFIKSSTNIGIDELEIINACDELKTFLESINELKGYEISIEYAP